MAIPAGGTGGAAVFVAMVMVDLTTDAATSSIEFSIVELCLPKPHLGNAHTYTYKGRTATKHALPVPASWELCFGSGEPPTPAHFHPTPITHCNCRLVDPKFILSIFQHTFQHTFFRYILLVTPQQRFCFFLSYVLSIVL
jgi:hypothetical protein